MKTNKTTKNRNRYPKRYMPGLDGLRAIAVIGIIIYHLNKQWLSGGFLGVDTFFVISGYLITSLLLSEYEETGTIKIKQFWLRRIKRLLPAVLILIFTVIIATLIFKPSHIVQIKHDAFAALFYMSNWWYIATDVNYFEQFAFMPLKHLWSLAIEEQFYLFFPFILVLLLFKFNSYKKVTLILWIVSLISLTLMILISLMTTGNSRVYFGTDTRLQTILLGVILAFAWPPFKLNAQPPKILQIIIGSVGTSALLILITLFFTVEDDSAWIYNGGFYLISALTLLIIASAVHPSNAFARVLGNEVFVYIGQRSYSLYLWHFPIISFIHSYYVAGQYLLYVFILDLILTVALAEISYRYIEVPFRKHGFRIFSFNHLFKTSLIRTIVALCVCVPTILVFLGAFDKLGKDDIAHKKTTFHSTNNGKKIVKPKRIDNNEVTDKQSKPKKDVKDLSPLLLGDSVMVDIGDTFKDKVPNADIDGKVGRNLYEALPLVNSQYRDKTQKGNQVVLELGTNGDFSKSQLDELITRLGEADIYLINVRVPRPYEQHVNDLLAQAAKEHSNVKLINWYETSEGHTEYFAPDGIHLEQKGVDALTDQIVNALKK